MDGRVKPGHDDSEKTLTVPSIPFVIPGAAEGRARESTSFFLTPKSWMPGLGCAAPGMTEE
jgi:hypothetical protein